MNCGIYLIKGPSGRIYVGGTLNLRRRKSKHFCGMRKPDRTSHKANPAMQADFDTHGEAAFSFEVLEYISDPSKLLEIEQHWIDTLLPTGMLYNVCKVSGSRKGDKPSALTLQRLSDVRIGVPKSAEHRARIADSVRAAHARRKLATGT